MSDRKEKDMTEQEIMSDFDEDKYAEAYCRGQKCKQCEGTDWNGESNGYGCTGLDDRIQRMYLSILKRRQKKLSE